MSDEQYLTRDEARQLFGPMLLAVMAMIKANAAPPALRDEAWNDAEAQMRAVAEKLNSYGLLGGD